MATPSKKSTAITNVIDNLSISMGRQSRTGAIKTDTCVMCKKPAIEFKDELSKKEYTISGMCQECQDNIFS